MTLAIWRIIMLPISGQNKTAEAYILAAMSSDEKNLGKLVKEQRIRIGLTLGELAAMSGVSSSHLGHIERGERFPSARVLHRIAEPLGFGEIELLTLAGYLSPQPPSVAESHPHYAHRALDSYVASVLSEEQVEIQRAVITILKALKK
ncbi:MAG: helix-turn-helix domain-containing protein [Dehalococcoidia bacterium]|nr:helix-turn-helix domain-containing protein [Dehalococcoidia bacterium]